MLSPADTHTVHRDSHPGVIHNTPADITGSAACHRVPWLETQADEGTFTDR